MSKSSFNLPGVARKYKCGTQQEMNKNVAVWLQKNALPVETNYFIANTCRHFKKIKFEHTFIYLTMQCFTKIFAIVLLLLLTSFTGLGQTISLFNGKDLGGWHVDVPDMDSNATAINPFIIRNGMLVSLGTPNGHLITDAVYQNYRLVVEYRFAGTPGNCGVLVHASTPRALYKMFPKSIEAQMMHDNAGDFWCIVEDITVPDMEKRRGPKENWGITEGKARRIINLTDSSEKPFGQWNTMIVECVDGSIKVWVNGDLVNYGYNCTADKGNIALQAEGSEVEFRKLELTPIKELTP